MAYSNGVFYVNIDTGNDGARTALTTCIASNPSGTVTRINKVGHGLVTGAVVDLTLFSAWLNDAWKITKVDNDNFDLDGAVWQTTADNNGTVTPRGGSSWTDGWASANGGVSAARIQPGDQIRFSKTPDPVSIGNVTWTNDSNSLTLATAQTSLIDDCETAWTAVNGATVTVVSNSKRGSNSLDFSKSSWTANTLYAYKTISTTDFSMYDAITLWVQSKSYNYPRIKICLCSDTAGTTIVDEFVVSDTNYTEVWMPYTIQRTGGGNLGSAIQSIAIYTTNTLPIAGTRVFLDNISACNFTGLNLTSLISKNSSAIWHDEGWWPIRSISGTNIILDDTNNTPASSTSGKYFGTTETTISAVRSTKKQGPSGVSPPLNAVYESGTPSSPIVYSGGWNVSTNVQDGITFFDGQNGVTTGGFAFHQPNSNTGHNNITIDSFGFCRFNYGINIAGKYSVSVFDYANNIVKNVFICSCTKAGINNIQAIGGSYAYPSGFTFENVFFMNTIQSDEAGTVIGRDWKYINCIFYEISNSDWGADAFFYNCKFKTAGTSQIYLHPCLRDNYHCAINTIFNDTIQYTSVSSAYSYGAARISVNFKFKNCLFLPVVEFFTPQAYYNQRIISQNHDLTGYEYGLTDGGTFNTEATDRAGASGKMWRLVLTNNTRVRGYPIDLQVGQFAVSANNLVTITAWMKKSHATNCDGRLRVRGYQIAGVDTDQIATLANNTDWQQLTITFTPTEAGVFEVEALAEYVAGNANVYIDQVEVTQA